MSETTERTFIGAVLAGDAFAADVDDWIDVWHESPSDGMELPDFLGMSWDEYQIFAERPESLRFILASRRNKQPLTALLSEVQVTGAAARSEEAGQAASVLQWLVDMGRVESRRRPF